MGRRRFTIERVEWEASRDELRAVRHPVFVVEQAVPPVLEWNEGDEGCVHVLARDEAARPIGTGRIDGTGKIGRMAVLAPWRRRGVGEALLGELLAIAAEQGLAEVRCHAQTRALDFYEVQGFVAEGEVFLEADIPHRTMRRPVRDPGSE